MGKININNGTKIKRENFYVFLFSSSTKKKKKLLLYIDFCLRYNRIYFIHMVTCLTPNAEISSFDSVDHVPAISYIFFF